MGPRGLTVSLRLYTSGFVQNNYIQIDVVLVETQVVFLPAVKNLAPV